MTIDYHTALEGAVFHAVNSGGGGWLDAAFLVLSSEWFGLATGAAIVAAIALRHGRRSLVLLLAFALAVTLSDLVAAEVLKPFFGRMRPCYALPEDTFRWVGWAADVGSLPSLHASNFFAMAGVAWASDRRAGIAAVLVAALVALSRVYLGVHWPSDVLAGTAWGLACAWTALLACRAVERRVLRRQATAGARPDLERLLVQVRDWAAAQDDVQAVLLVGSHARGQARADSDLDLVILARDPERFLRAPSFAGFLGEVARTTTEEWGKLTSVRCWYASGLEVEFGFAGAEWIAGPPFDPGTARVLGDGARVLLDRLGGLEEVVRSAKPAPG